MLFICFTSSSLSRKNGNPVHSHTHKSSNITINNYLLKVVDGFTSLVSTISKNLRDRKTNW